MEINFSSWVAGACTVLSIAAVVRIVWLVLMPPCRQPPGTLVGLMLRQRQTGWASRRRSGHPRPSTPVDADAPRHGYKRCWVLRRRTDGAVRFVALFDFGPGLRLAYGSEARASCYVDPEHQAPDPGCHCGFYALTRREDLGYVAGSAPSCSALGHASLVTLEVEISGRVIDGDFGCRGQFQRVLRAFCQPRCVRCWAPRRRATGFCWVPAEVDFWETEPPKADVLAPACRRHADPTLALADVAGLLGTEVVFGQ